MAQNQCRKKCGKFSPTHMVSKVIHSSIVIALFRLGLLSFCFFLCPCGFLPGFLFKYQLPKIILIGGLATSPIVVNVCVHGVPIRVCSCLLPIVPKLGSRSTMTLTWTQDWTGDPGAVKPPFYLLPLSVYFYKKANTLKEHFSCPTICNLKYFLFHKRFQERSWKAELMKMHKYIYIFKV